MKESIVEIHLRILDVCGLCIATDSNFLLCKLFKLSDIYNTARSEAVISAKAIHFAKPPAFGAQSLALFQNYSKVPFSDK